MKRTILAILLITLVFTSSVFAASSMVVGTVLKYPSSDRPIRMVVPITCTAHTDGTFDVKQLTTAEIGLSYHKQAFSITDAWVVNSATDDHTNAAVVTITDTTGKVLVGLGDGADDTLTLLQSASGVARIVLNRNSSQRAVTHLLNIAIADTGGSATVQTLYLQFEQ